MAVGGTTVHYGDDLHRDGFWPVRSVLQILQKWTLVKPFQIKENEPVIIKYREYRWVAAVTYISASKCFEMSVFLIQNSSHIFVSTDVGWLQMTSQW